MGLEDPWTARGLEAPVGVTWAKGLGVQKVERAQGCRRWRTPEVGAGGHWGKQGWGEGHCPHLQPGASFWVVGTILSPRPATALLLT